MIPERGQPGLAAVLLLAAGASPHLALADSVGEAERDLAALEQRLGVLEREAGLREESVLAKAERAFSDGETQFLLGDWTHAAVLIYEAVDAPGFRSSPHYPDALWYLAESLYQQRNYLSAAPYFKALLALRGSPREGAAIARSLDVAIRLGSYGGVDALVDRSQSLGGGRAPPEVLYLRAKALYRRRDLAPALRLARARQALAEVPPPFHLAAAYLAGALEVQAGALGTAAEKFEGCTRLEAREPPQREMRELCYLALGRVYGEMGRYADAVDRYQEVPRDSPRFEEALYEIAWTQVRAKRLEPALRTATMIADLSPGSPLAPEASILAGHLFLRLGRYGEAVETYNRIINQYAPVRDELDAILAFQEDPVRYFDELIGSDRAFDVATLLPPVAVKWASTQREVGTALSVVRDLDRSRRDLRQGLEIADRVESAIARGQGLDAFPPLKGGYARADAVRNAAARVEGRLTVLETDQLREVLPEGVRAEVEKQRRERAGLEARVRSLPTSPEEVEAREKRLAGEFEAVDRGVFQLGYVVESCNAAIAGTQLWLDEHRDAVSGNAEQRAEFLEEMRRHREEVAAFGEELRTLRHEISKALDAAVGTELLVGDAALRVEYRAALQRERGLHAFARREPDPRARDVLARGGPMRERIAALDERAGRLQEKLSAGARAGAQEVRDRLAAERRILKLYGGELVGVQDEARDLVGRIAYQSFRKVRAQFYKLLLKADVGIVDIAWQRKRERLDKIQQLSAQKAAELRSVEEEYRAMLREVQ